MNDFQDKIVHFGLILVGIILFGIIMGLYSGNISFNLELILDSLKPFLYPAYTYDFLNEFMSRDYFINKHLLADKTYFSLAIVTIIYSLPIFLMIIPIRLLKLPEKYSKLSSLGSTIFSIFLIPIGISIFFLAAFIPATVIFSIAPALIKGFFQ